MSNVIAPRDDSVQEHFTNLADMGGATRRARRCKTQSSFSYETRSKMRVFFCSRCLCMLCHTGPMINVQYEAPEGQLASLLSSLYRLDFEGDYFCEIERADRAQFRFQLLGTGEYHFATGEIVETFPVTIIGPTTGPVTAKSQGSLSIFGWGLVPGGWAALMGSEAADYIDRAFDARMIFGPWIMEIRDRLRTQILPIRSKSAAWRLRIFFVSKRRRLLNLFKRLMLGLPNPARPMSTASRNKPHSRFDSWSA
jgi:hypothetical protein